jgi:eukaryotic-like serine/threonine-protein kinase
MTTSASIDTAYWKRIDALLEVALSLPRSERQRWLDSLDPNAQLYKQVLTDMLARTDAETDHFMDRPVALATLEAAADGLQEDKPEDIVGPYKLLRRMGAGGMGTVWYAERVDGAVHRKVALKLPRASWSPGLAERLKRECEILSTLEHPNIARLYDAGLTSTGRPYLAMESIEGVSVDQYCRTHRLSVTERLKLFLAVVKAIAYAHARLVVHRDLKPSNVLVDGEGNVHVVDFGLAKLLTPEGEQQTRLTQVSDRALTPDYASPEQIRGETITVASDVYSLGVVLYELLTDKRPYQLKRESVAALEEAITEADVPHASSKVIGDKPRARALRGDLDNILAKALRKNAHERYTTADALAADIERHLRGEPVEARPDSVSYRLGKFIRRNRMAVGAGTLLMLTIVAGVAGTIYQARIAADQARLANLERDRAVRELRFAQSGEEFMRFLLSEQSQKPLTGQELLARAEKMIEGQFSDDPQSHGRMQLLAGELYGELTDYANAERMLKGARGSAQSAADHNLAAQIDCVMAGLLGATGRRDQAAKLFHSTVPKLEAEADADVAARIACYVNRGIFHRNGGNPTAATQDAESALRLIATDRPGLRVNRIFLETQMADALALSGKLAEAVQTYEQAIAEMIRLGRGGTSAMGSATNNFMFLLVRAGQLKRAEEVYLRAGASGIRPDAAPQIPQHSTLMINYARALVDMGRPAEAEKLLEPARQAKHNLGDKRGELFAVLNMASAACAANAIDRCELLLATGEKQLPTLFPPGHSNYASVQMFTARIALARRDLIKADHAATQAVDMYTAARDRSPLRIRALSLLATIRQQRGDVDSAKRYAREAVEAAQDVSRGFMHSEWVGSALLAQASVLRAQGDTQPARTAATEAREHLLASVGAGSPAAKEVETLIEALGAPAAR